MGMTNDFEVAIEEGATLVRVGRAFNLTPRQEFLLKQAAEQFIMRLLPEDKGAVGSFNDKIELSAAFTADRDQLVEEPLGRAEE